jgi:hypothetical protein
MCCFYDSDTKDNVIYIFMSSTEITYFLRLLITYRPSGKRPERDVKTCSYSSGKYFVFSDNVDKFSYDERLYLITYIYIKCT